jgi:peptide/nickel transport system ATP-binding protein
VAGYEAVASATGIAADGSTDAGAATAPTMLSVSGLSIHFDGRAGRVEAVRDLSFALAARETLAIVGESGSGKSLTCRALLGLLPRGATATGSVRYAGREILASNDEELRGYRGREVAIVFQDAERALNPTMPIGRQISEAIRAHDPLERAAANRRAVELLSLLRLPTPQRLFFAYPHELSGGMRQRVMIAIAIAANPKVLIADEPTASLDVLTGALVIQLLEDLRRELEMALIVVTHDLRLVAAVSDAVLVMRAGRVIEHARTPQWLGNPQTEYGRALLAATPALDCQRSPVERRRGPPLLSVRDLVQDRGGTGLLPTRRRRVRAVAGVSFDLARGEIMGVVGETGAGKSTLVRSILQAPPPTSGSVLLQGRDLTQLRGRRLREQRRVVQLVFQDAFASLDPTWTVFDIVKEPLLKDSVNRTARAARVHAVLELVGLPVAVYGHRHADQLSGGQCQRVAIARALALAPEIIICDEAVSALDVLIQAQIVDLLRALRTELGLSILFVSHDLALVRGISDRLAVMLAGRFCEIGPVDVSCREPAHPYLADLIAASGFAHVAWTQSRNRSAAALDAAACPYCARCNRAQDRCRQEEPKLRTVDGDRLVACHYPLQSAEAR